MRIKWNIPYQTRILGDYVWSRETGFVQDVTDPQTALDALTSRHFTIADDDPLAAQFGAETAQTLLAEGVCTMEALTAMSKAQLREMGKQTPALRPVIEWAKGAQPANEQEETNEPSEVN